MTMRQNILLVTTRQWNPGDEFIMAGVKNILAELGMKFGVQAIYNKSPQVIGKLDRFNPFSVKVVNYSSGLADSFVKTGHFDNSFSAHDDISIFDLVVFCGSPGWFGGRLMPLYKKLDGYEGKILFVGIGSSNRDIKLSALEQRVMKKAKFVSCRDERLSKALTEQYGIANRFITCPALLAARLERPVTSFGKVGLVYTAAGTHRGHRVDPEHESNQNAIFKTIIDQCGDVEVVCNYYAEVDLAAQLFGKERVRYEYDALDYPALMSEYDFVVSSRVHGCGISSSVGTPNIMLGHDKRAKTVQGFGSYSSLDGAEILAIMSRFKSDEAISAESARVLQIKHDLMQLYISEIKPVFEA